MVPSSVPSPAPATSTNGWSGTAAAAAAKPPPPPPASAGGTNAAEKKAAAILASPGNFSVAAYLNVALQQQDERSDELQGSGSKSVDDEETQLQSRMAELALLLQVQTQSCHDEIGRIGAELRAILPRCKADVTRLEQGLGGMTDDAAGLLQHVGSTSASASALASGSAANGGGGRRRGLGKGKDKSGAVFRGGNRTSLLLGKNAKGYIAKKDGSSGGVVDPTATPSVDTLSTLHSLRTNLRRTRHILSAASSWDSTLSSIPGLLSAQNLSDAVVALSSLERGEKALSGGMPGRTERKEALARIRSQIEVLLRPQLLHALNKMDTRLGPLQQCVSMYVQLNKIETLAEEYVRLRPGDIHKLWFGFVPPSPPALATLAPTAPGTTASAVEESSSDGDLDDDELGFGGATTNEPAVASKPTSEAFASAFLAWLPGWYCSVLALLSEETRRASAVFGPKMAPDIVLRVFRECFRPILPSFGTRLSSLCPSNPSGGKHPSNETWSLDAICSAYKATLHFLSQWHEQLAINLDSSALASVSSSPNTPAAKGAIAAYNQITSAFIFVASPFAPYQQEFAKLEKKHCDVMSESVARDVQSVVGGRSLGSDLSSLQGTVDRLQVLASSVLPLAEAAVSRFELLNCGYHTNDAVAAIDELLARHAGEIAIAVSTLRTSMTTNEDTLAEKFDEDYVQSALEILKIAGGMKRDVLNCEAKTKDVFRELFKRLERFSYCFGTKSGNNTFELPHSMPSTDVALIIAKDVCGDKNAEEAAYDESSTLPHFLSGDKGGLARTASLYPKATEAVTRLAKTCHVFVFDVCSAVPRRALRNLPQLPIWRKEASDKDALTYGILPQQYINTVGEHMLALVQAIEPFASDPEALELADGVMDNVKDIALPSWRDFAAAIGGTDASRDEIVASLMNAQSIKEYVMTGMHVDETDKLEGEEEEDELVASAQFTNKWLDAIGLAVSGYLLERTLRIHSLSKAGGEHLSADYNYLINVFEALGIAGHPHPLLLHCTRLFSMPPDEMLISADTSSAMGRAIRASENRIALMRGVNAN
jgi:hypothetical protein